MVTEEDWSIGVDRPPGALPLPEETASTTETEVKTEEPEREPATRPTEPVPPELYMDVPEPTTRILSPEEIATIEATPPAAIAYVPDETILSGDPDRIVGELQAADAPLATQLNFLQSEGIELEALSPEVLQPIAEQINIINELTGEEQFNKAVELGFIPKGARYIKSTEGTWTYASPILTQEAEQTTVYFEANNTRLPDGQ